ncbi:HET-domain-containing protein [Rhizodiscina lignyota]|uniref:HET-domain-containing protein n=1 Tax=Rhizodiscina lignyota TaxID=1504668 RepID=A0A9P4I716_9PEZI|nr:HET-domain-containing protein [Rhizodiscina lignyota]
MSYIHSCQYCSSVTIHSHRSARRPVYVLEDTPTRTLKAAPLNLSFNEAVFGARKGCPFLQWVTSLSSAKEKTCLNVIWSGNYPLDSAVPANPWIWWLGETQENPENIFRTVHKILAEKANILLCAEENDPAAEDFNTRPPALNLQLKTRFVQARGWLEECVKTHKCREENAFVPSHLILIDSTANPPNLRLVTREETSGIFLEYAALSYCWGKTQDFTLTSSSLESFLSSIPYDKLPQTIKDAILVTSEMGLRYLWVDAFCVIQDSNEEKAKEIGQMAEIYDHAHVTIAASKAKSVNEGFLWWPRIEMIRLGYECSSGEIGSVLFSPELNGDTRFSPEPLDTRGWALQEELLSPRRLEFGTYQSRWTCRETVKEDETVVDGWLKRKVTSPYMYGRVLSPQPVSWWDIVEIYTTRSLSDPHDRLRAISAVARKLGELSRDEYVAGLWRSSFIKGLHWGNFAQEQTKKEEDMHLGRLKNEDSDLHGTAPYIAPSWSWASVSHPVEFHYFYAPNELQQVKIAIIDIRTKTEPPDDPYGPLCDGSLKIKGPCCSFVVGERSELHAVNSDNQFVTHVSFPSVLVELDMVSGDHLFLLLLSVRHGEGYCLVLKQTDEEQYIRVGFMRLSGPSQYPVLSFEYKKEEWKEQIVTIL